MKNKKEFKEEPARHFDFWVKEKDSKIHFPTTVKIDKDGKPVTINDYCKNVLKLTKEK